jgi:CRISPR-associated protein Cas2
MKKWYLVSYDIRDPKRLRRTAKKMCGYGERIQFSLFRCRLGEREVERLRWELKKIVAPEDDVLIIGLCGDCVRTARRKSGRDDWPDEDVTFVIV